MELNYSQLQYRKHREKILKYKMEYHIKNRENILRKQKERYRKINPIILRKFYPEIKIKDRKERNHIVDITRQEVIKKLGAKCVKCGFSDVRALQIDHINGGGEKERKEISYKRLYWNVLNDNGTKYQLLCANCNWIKRYENNEFRQRIN